MEQSEREQRQFNDFFSEIEALLQVTYDRVNTCGSDADGRLVDLIVAIECALRVFMRLSKKRPWTRIEKEFTMENVNDVCAFVMEAIALVGTTDSESLDKLRVVLRTAQRMFGNIDKQITVRVVYISEGVRTYHTPTTYMINADRTVQRAVKQQYAAFPGACQRVVYRHGFVQLDLWDRTPHKCAFFSRDKYDMVEAGGEIDIVVEHVCPDGPKAAPAWRAASHVREIHEERDMQTMLSLLKAIAAAGGGENGSTPGKPGFVASVDGC